MKAKVQTAKAIFVGSLFMALFLSPTDRETGQSFYRREYSRMYLDHTRKKYEIIYNDNNKSLEELTGRKQSR